MTKNIWDIKGNTWVKLKLALVQITAYEGMLSSTDI